MNKISLEAQPVSRLFPLARYADSLPVRKDCIYLGIIGQESTGCTFLTSENDYAFQGKFLSSLCVEHTTEYKEQYVDGCLRRAFGLCVTKGFSGLLTSMAVYQFV